MISIIALLIGILLPSLAKVRELANKTGCASNLRQIGLAIRSYAEANNQLYPDARYMPSPFITTDPGTPGLPAALHDEMDPGQKVYRCPGDDVVFSVCGISYTYNTMLATNKPPDQNWMVTHLNLSTSEIPVAWDFDNNTYQTETGSLVVPAFHSNRNILFADGHAADRVQ